EFFHVVRAEITETKPLRRSELRAIPARKKKGGVRIRPRIRPGETVRIEASFDRQGRQIAADRETPFRLERIARRELAESSEAQGGKGSQDEEPDGITDQDFHTFSCLLR